MITNNIGYDFNFANQTSSTGNGNAMAVGGLNYVTVEVTAVAGMTGNIIPQKASAIPNGVPVWRNVPCIDLSTNAQIANITACGTYLVPVPGADQLQMNVVTLAAGTITIQGKGSVMPPPIVIVAFQSSSTLGTVGQGSSPWVDNVSQWGGANVVTGGTAGSVGVGGLAAPGGAAVGNPVEIAGQDAAGNVQVPQVNANKSLMTNFGNSDKPTYTVSFNLNPTAAIDLATLEAGTTKKLRLSRIVFTNVGCQTTAGQRNLQLVRTTTAGTGNTIANTPLDPNDANFTGITRSGATGTGLGTAGAVLANLPLWIPAAQAIMSPIVIPFGGDQSPSDKRPLSVQGPGNGLSLRDPGAANGTGMAGFVEFTEE
jgi:hypothetical protein